MEKARDGHYWGNGFDPDPPVLVERGRWICVEIMLRCNSAPETADGEQALWIDGREVARFGGIRWRTHEDLKVNGIWMLDYITEQAGRHNRVAEPRRANRVWFDEIVVAAGPIGPFVGGEIVGRVVDGEGAPLAGVAVTTCSNRPPHQTTGLWLPPRPVTEKTVTTDPDGRYRFGGLRPSRYRLHFEIEGRGASELWDYRVRANATTEVPDLVLLHGAAVRGRVLVDGEPCAAASVVLFRVAVEPPHEGVVTKVVTDANGRFETPRLEPGRYHASARRMPILTLDDVMDSTVDVVVAERSSSEVDVPADGDPVELELRITTGK
jgi:hypothetical protein